MRRYVYTKSVISGVFFYVFSIVLNVSNSDVIPFADQSFQNGYSYSEQYSQKYQSPHQSRSSRAIPVSLAMQLNTVTDEKEFFEHFIENGHDLLPSLYKTSVPRANRRLDVEEFNSEHGSSGLRVGRVADARTYATRDTNIELHQSAHHPAPLNAAPSRNINRQGTGGGSRVITADNLPDDSPPKVFYSETAVKIPKPASCEPEIRTVSLKDVNDSTYFYFPSCTRVKRCGGCCAHDLLSCQPRMLQYTNYTVKISKYNGKEKLTYFGTKTIMVEEHLNCSCQCKVKARDCTPPQRYEKHNCRCVCDNEKDEDECTREHGKKIWNSATCSCQCRETSECSSGYYFDEKTCTCVPNHQTPDPLVEYENIERGRYQMNYVPSY